MATLSLNEFRQKVGYSGNGGKISESSMNAKQTIASLAEDGLRIITEANNTKQTKNRTYNQRDAYAYAVFFYGKMVAKGFLSGGQLSTGTHRGWVKHNYPDGTGREFADDAINSFTANPRIAYTLICLNGAFYSKILEGGEQSLYGGKFKIMSQMADEMDILAKKYKGRSFQFNPIRT